MDAVRQPSVTAYLTVCDGRKAIALYQRAFDASVLMQKMDEDGLRVVHAALDVFGTMIMLSDEVPEYAGEVRSPLCLGGTTVSLHVDLDTPEQVNLAMEKAEAEGFTVTMPAADRPWGMRYGRITDSFGHAWAFGAALAASQEK